MATRTVHASSANVAKTPKSLIYTLTELMNDIVALGNEVRADFNLLHADVTEIRTKLVATHAKLDADAGVTDTNYAALNNPAAITATLIAAAVVDDISLRELGTP